MARSACGTRWVQDVHAVSMHAAMCSDAVQGKREVCEASASSGTFRAHCESRPWLLPRRRHTRTVSNTVDDMSCRTWSWVVHVFSRHSKTLVAVGEQIGV